MSSPPPYETVIGLEVHAQLLTRSKLFCGCSAQFGALPNSHVCPVCLGLPGALPVINERAVELAIRAALALQCEVCPQSVFERKNYFYPDLAKNYQISQYLLPLNRRGRLQLDVGQGPREVGITRIHMEEDAAKNLHGALGRSRTLVDYNRAGVPLIEIVSDPDMRSAAEAEEYLRRLREILMFVGANDGNLEQGSFRCDANVSVRPRGQSELGTRTELKNINSFRFVRKAIEYEAARQQAVLAGGGRVEQETRTWNEGQGKTITMRGKEEAEDYRYFPDPDLLPLRVEPERIERIAGELLELPAARRVRYRAELGLTEDDAAVLTSHPALAELFEATAAATARGAGLPLEQAGKRAANFIQSELMRHVTYDGLSAEIPVSASSLAELLSLVEGGTISGKIAKGVLTDMIESGRGARQIVDEKGLAQVSDGGLIEQAVRELIDKHPDKVAEYRGGKQSLLGWFVGQVMKATKGQANPRMVNETLRKLL